ncbi:MAG: class I SAM-dependent methyltransferase [Polyangiaceae bacterium]|nr:class I SAM-dependent methyltransferase [Polyangiaceae bacterium]
MNAATNDPLRCPDCLGSLDRGAGARCSRCGARYGLSDGILDLLGSKSAINRSELETQDRVSDYYENARYKHAFSRAYHEHTLDILLRAAEPRGSILDDGCGNGIFIEHLRERGAGVTRFFGIDLSFGMLRHARRRHEDLDLPGAVVRADACRLPFADSSFDVVYARSLLHHLPDPSEGVREIARVLKPGGTMVALDPNKTFVSELPRAISRKSEHFDDDHKNFALGELVGLIEPHLHIERTEFVGYVAYPLLGFPDLMNFGRYLPLDSLAPSLMRLDDVLARVPVVRRLAWGVVLSATKQ